MKRKICDSEFSESDANINQKLKTLSKNIKNKEEKKGSSFIKRTIVTLILIPSFILIILMGHFYCCLLVFAIQFGIFHEIMNIKRNYLREKKIKFSIFLYYYFFFIISIYFPFKIFNENFIITSTYINHFLNKFSYSLFLWLWLIGFLIFILTLKKGYKGYQVRLFFWCHIVNLIIWIMTTSYITIYNGLIWFILFTSLVIMNDINAYIFGKLFGKTQLIKLSPNKTVEGFVYAMFLTLFQAFLVY